MNSPASMACAAKTGLPIDIRSVNARHRRMIALPFLLAALTAPTSPQEIPRMEPLIEQPATTPAPDTSDRVSPATLCSKDKRWCAFLSRDVDLNTVTLNIYNGQLPPIIKDGRSYARGVGSYPVGAMVEDSENASMKIWPMIIRQPTPRSDGIKLNETISIGIESGQSTGYSGGGAQSTSLQLYQLLPSIDDNMPEPINFGTVLQVPLSGYKMIRACFGEENYKKRLGVCHDEYDFKATLTLGKTMPGSAPQIVYQSTAITTPGSSRLDDDNTLRQLTPSDIKPRRDRICSYRRVYTYDGEFGSYFTPKQIPDCADYMVP